MQAEDLLSFEVIDTIIKEPLGGAHQAPTEVYNNVREFILEQWELLKNFPYEVLLEQRYQKFRKMGRFENSRD
jgi:acetyl-CoA carboxylase carboxyl transferase subunit alpha